MTADYKHKHFFFVLLSFRNPAFFFCTETLCYIAFHSPEMKATLLTSSESFPNLHANNFTVLSSLVFFIDTSRIRFGLPYSLLICPNRSASVFESKHEAPRTVLQHVTPSRNALIAVSVSFTSSLQASPSKPSKRIYDRNRRVLFQRFVHPIRPTLPTLFDQDGDIYFSSVGSDVMAT